MESSQLAVDTHGYTDFAMMLARLLGFDLCPRLKELKQRHLFLPKGMDIPPEIAAVCEADVNTDLIKKHWDTLVHLAASVMSGNASVFANMYGNLPNQWQVDLTGFDRLRVITNAMTRMRICSEQGEMEFTFKGGLQDIPNGYTPWFDAPFRQSQTAKIICGHWSALGLRHRDNIYALDTGCLWGGQLTAMCLESQEITQVNHDVRDRDVRDRVLKPT